MHTIIATQMISPRFSVGKNNPVPVLSRWSDWAWAVWESVCTGSQKSATDLRYIIHDHITTLDTRMIMHKITGAPISEYVDLHLEWPGLLFTMDQDQGLALLGTPHGQGIAYLIRDHSDQIQTRKPTVRMWVVHHPAFRDDPGNGYYYLLWDLKPDLPFGANGQGAPQPPGPPPPPPPPPQM